MCIRDRDRPHNTWTRFRVSAQDLYGIHRFTPGVPSVITEAGYLESGVFDVLTASGIVPLDDEGELSSDQGATASFLYGDWIGDRFGDMVTSVQ